MSDIVEWVLQLDIQVGQGDKVRPLLDEMVAMSEAEEPDALHYVYYTNDDRTKVTVLERYTDSAAAMVHLGKFEARYADRFFAVFAPTRFTVFGPASAELRTALSGFGAVYMKYEIGFSRK